MIFCSFGEPTCGLEDVAGILMIAGALSTLIAALVAAVYSRPVVSALRARTEQLEVQNGQQARQIADHETEMAHLRELATNAANVDALRAEAKRDHEGLSGTLEKISESLAKQTATQAITSRTLLAIARKLEVSIRTEDEG